MVRFALVVGVFLSCVTAGRAGELRVGAPPGEPERGVGAPPDTAPPAGAAGGAGGGGGVAPTRRVGMQDGSVGWNPRKQGPRIARPAGPTGPGGGGLLFESPPGRPLAT